jgi:hypothetical protein
LIVDTQHINPIINTAPIPSRAGKQGQHRLDS